MNVGVKHAHGMPYMIYETTRDHPLKNMPSEGMHFGGQLLFDIPKYFESLYFGFIHEFLLTKK